MRSDDVAMTPAPEADESHTVDIVGTSRSHKATDVFRSGDGDEESGPNTDVDMLLTVKVRPVARTQAGERLLEYTSFVSYKSVQLWTLVVTLADWLFSCVALFAPGWFYVGLYGSERRGLWAECKVETCRELDDKEVEDYLVGVRVLMFFGWIFISILAIHRVMLMVQHGRKYGGLPVTDPLTKVSTSTLLGSLHFVVSLLHMIAFSVYLAEEPDMGAGAKHVGYCVGLAVWVWISEAALGIFFFSVSGQYKRRPFVESVGMKYVSQVALANARRQSASDVLAEERAAAAKMASMAEKLEEAAEEEKDYVSEEDVDVDLEAPASPFPTSPPMSEEDKALQNAALQEARAKQAAEEAEALVLAHAHAQAAKLAVERRRASSPQGSSRGSSPGTVPGDQDMAAVQSVVPPPVPMDDEEVEEVEDEDGYIDSSVQKHV